MAGTLERPLSVEERLRKAKALVDEGSEGFVAAEAADAELSIRRQAAVACETAFHGLIELVDVLLERSGHRPVENHDQRREALDAIGRPELATVYSEAFHSLHISGYYAQRAGPFQRTMLRRVREIVLQELRKLA